MPTLAYSGLVDTARQTCGACPTQWEGRLRDGRYFYYRYRSGVASLAIGATAGEVAGRQDVTERIGDYLDGSLSDLEYHESFLRLFDLHR